MTVITNQRKVQRVDTDGSWLTFNAAVQPNGCVLLHNGALGLRGTIPGSRFEELRLQQEKSRRADGYARPAMTAIPLSELTVTPNPQRGS
jgi:hypothetical protein